MRPPRPGCTSARNASLGSCSRSTGPRRRRDSGSCFWLDEGVFDQDQVDQLEEHLDNGLTEMLSDLRRLTQANMSEEIERFAAALNANLILPEDF